jgi:alpha-1,6-mannosyltransferase
MTGSGFTVCDLSPFYCEKGGGIRTYHRARIDWFAQQTRHRYVLIAPGPCFARTAIAPTVQVVQVYGPAMSRDGGRYRLLLDYPAVQSVIRQIQPDVLEANDPWFSMPFALRLRQRGLFQGLVTTFCHSDPVVTYIAPRAERWLPGSKLAGKLVDWLDERLSALHARFDATFVSSEAMRAKMARLGLINVVKVGFGIDPELLMMRRRRRKRRTRLLYAGRLDDDKEFGLLLNAMPELLGWSDVSVTVVGNGKYQADLAAYSHPRFRYLGFLSDRAAMRAVYAAHDVLLAPGRFETFGLSALEASAAGLIVVGPDCGGTGELLRELESPLAFTAGHRRMFVERVAAAIDSDTAGLAERGRLVATRHGTWRESVARHVAAHEQLLGYDNRTEAIGLPA